jgi:hypothetical protein
MFTEPLAVSDSPQGLEFSQREIFDPENLPYCKPREEWSHFSNPVTKHIRGTTQDRKAPRPPRGIRKYNGYQ